MRNLWMLVCKPIKLNAATSYDRQELIKIVNFVALLNYIRNQVLLFIEQRSKNFHSPVNIVVIDPSLSTS